MGKPKVICGKVSKDDLITLLNKYPIPQIKSSSNETKRLPMKYAYGTSGFRYDALLLECVFVRMGLFAALRSAALGGEGVGLMVTASHNPEADNGIKLSDPDGGMMASSWETHAVELANAPTTDTVLTILQNLFSTETTTTTTFTTLFNETTTTTTTSTTHNKSMIIHLGRDTRSHSKSLSEIVIESATLLGAKVIDHGEITTPQLHFIVLQSNPHYLPNLIPLQYYGESGYIDLLCYSYTSLLQTKIINNNDDNDDQNEDKKKQTRRLVVDCACGIGGPKVKTIRQHLLQFKENSVNLDNDNDDILVDLIPVNLPGDGILNHECGAEHVQKKRLPPTIFTSTTSSSSSLLSSLSYVASLDGDADRIVFHYQDNDSDDDDDSKKKDEDKKFHLLDGDKIAVLVSSFIQEELNVLFSDDDDTTTENEEKDSLSKKKLKCGVVQTAYANGASTHYLKNVIKTQVVTAKTGVKYVHTVAHNTFDIGIYFEANGHGTVLFGPKFYQFLSNEEFKFHLQKPKKLQLQQRKKIALQRLRILPSLINQAIGDALSDLLLVDAILYLKQWTIQIWNDLYNDMPSCQGKIQVEDRLIITTNENETRALTPSTLQPLLDKAMSSISSSSSRCFVRPSGTENVVRIYAEAKTQEEANELANLAAKAVHQECCGIGIVPNLH